MYRNCICGVVLVISLYFCSFDSFYVVIGLKFVVNF